MITYTMYERPDGRVILGTHLQPKDVPIRSVKAKSFEDARKHMRQFENVLVYHMEGHGWFRK